MANTPLIEMDVAKTLAVLKTNLKTAKDAEKKYKEDVAIYEKAYDKYKKDMETYRDAIRKFIITKGEAEHAHVIEDRYGRAYTTTVTYSITKDYAGIPKEPVCPQAPTYDKPGNVKVSLGNRDYIYKPYVEYIQGLINTLECCTTTTVPSTLIASIQTAM